MISRCYKIILSVKHCGGGVKTCLDKIKISCIDPVFFKINFESTTTTITDKPPFLTSVRYNGLHYWNSAESCTSKYGYPLVISVNDSDNDRDVMGCWIDK